MEYLLVWLLGAIGYRLKGGGGHDWLERRLLGRNLDTQWRRIVYWVWPAGALLYATMFPPGVSALSMIIAVSCYYSIWLGVVPGYFGGSFGLDDEASRTPKNYLRLTLRAMFDFAPLAAVLIALRALGLYDGGAALGGVAAGMLFVPFYLAGVWLQRFVPRNGFMAGSTQIGECLIGGTALLAAFLTV